MSQSKGAFDIARINTSNIYQYFIKEDYVTKQDLVSEMNLTLPTITKNIDYLTGEGLIAAKGSRGQTGGRSAVVYSLVADAKIALGLDITRHHVGLAAVNLKGQIISFQRKWLPFENKEEYFVEIRNLLEDFIRKSGIDRARILGVGIGIPALVREDNKHIFYSGIIDKLDDNVYGNFKKHIPYDIQLFNDAKAAAFAERWKNNLIKNDFYLMLSNNVGGAMIINGKVYSGNGFKSAEVGHMMIVPRGKKCYCGQRGCVDPYLAASKLSGDDLAGFFKKLEKGDKNSMELWNDYLNNLAITVRNINILLDCNIIIGGYVGSYIEPYITELRKRTQKLNTFEKSADFIKLCSYKNESIAAGAALHYISEFVYSV